MTFGYTDYHLTISRDQFKSKFAKFAVSVFILDVLALVLVILGV